MLWVEMECQESVWGGKADLPSIQHPSHEKPSALSQNLGKRLACLFLPAFLFMGEKECSAVMQTGKDCFPEKHDYSLLIITEKANNRSLYKNLKQNTIQIPKLDTLSSSLANLSTSIWR